MTKILIVDDDQAEHRIFIDAMKAERLDVVFVQAFSYKGASEAIENPENTDIKIVILDGYLDRDNESTGLMPLIKNHLPEAISVCNSSSMRLTHELMDAGCTHSMYKSYRLYIPTIKEILGI